MYKIVKSEPFGFYSVYKRYLWIFWERLWEYRWCPHLEKRMDFSTIEEAERIIEKDKNKKSAKYNYKVVKYIK